MGINPNEIRGLFELKRASVFFTHPVGNVDDSMQKYGQHIVQLVVTYNSGWTKDNNVVQRLTTINNFVRPIAHPIYDNLEHVFCHGTTSIRNL